DFLLFDVLGAERLQALPGCEEVDRDLVNAVLSEAGRFAAEVLAPLNRVGDEQGCRLENGRVVTPDGFRAAFAGYRDGGWT
ncbi:acyl-CoA dehydrogenase N-terminal domain-containing protein, partial [Mycobacterium tuberculosis]|nr:acyl-CoA dehydrogenase N-terminal domain-containing protein [Mycobacterium tuberculosis]